MKCLYCAFGLLVGILVLHIVSSQQQSQNVSNSLMEYCDENETHVPYNVGWLKEGTKEHHIRGKVFIIDKYRFRIDNFSYDGEAPGTYVLAMKKGTKGVYSNGGYMLLVFGKDQAGQNKYSCTHLLDPAYRFGNLSLTVALPAGKHPNVTTTDVRAISIYSYEFCVNFRSREISELPAKLDPSVGETTPYCDPPKQDMQLIESAGECEDFPQICSGSPMMLPVLKFVLLVTILTFSN